MQIGELLSVIFYRIVFFGDPSFCITQMQEHSTLSSFHRYLMPLNIGRLLSYYFFSCEFHAHDIAIYYSLFPLPFTEMYSV